MLLEIEKKELRWLYVNCPAWGGHLRRGEPVKINSPLHRYIENDYIRPTEDGYMLTQRGIDSVFHG